MKREILTDYTWIERRIDGQFAALYPFQRGSIAPHVQLAHRRIMLPEQVMLGDLGRMIPYLRVSQDGWPFRIGAIDAPRDPNGEHKGYWEWSEELGWQLHKPLVIDVPNATIYRGAELIVATPVYGAMGLRYIDMFTGNPIGADDTVNGATSWAAVCGVTNLWEWTQHFEITVGKNSRDELIAVTGGKRYVLTEGGQWWFPRFQRLGDQCAVSATSMHMERAIMISFTLQELLAGVFPEEKVIEPPPPPFEPKPISPPSTSTGKFDLLNFLIGERHMFPRGGPTHAMNQVVEQKSVLSALFHFIKFDNPEAYETWAYDENWIYHLEDASSEPYSFGDPRWFPRKMQIGEAHAFDTGEHLIFFRDRVNCAPKETHPFRRKMWVHAVYDQYDWGKDLGVRPTMVIAYDPTGGIHIPQRGVELGYYALGAGTVRWEWYRSDLVYANGHAEFPDAARGARSDFYYLGGKNLAPKRTGCVGDTIPHYPPLEPEPEPEPEATMIYVEQNPTDNLRANGRYERHQNADGSTSLKQENGKYACLTPEGHWEERDSPGGPWESFKLSGNVLVAEREKDGVKFAFFRLCAEVK